MRRRRCKRCGKKVPATFHSFCSTALSPGRREACGQGGDLTVDTTPDLRQRSQDSVRSDPQPTCASNDTDVVSSPSVGAKGLLVDINSGHEDDDMDDRSRAWREVQDRVRGAADNCWYLLTDELEPLVAIDGAIALLEAARVYVEVTPE